MHTSLLRATATLALVGLATALVASAPQAPAQSSSAPRFEDVADASGLRFVHDNGARGEFWLPEIMGAGVALFDYDNDGDLDVFLVQGAAPNAERRTPNAERTPEGNAARTAANLESATGNRPPAGGTADAARRTQNAPSATGNRPPAGGTANAERRTQNAPSATGERQTPDSPGNDTRQAALPPQTSRLFRNDLDKPGGRLRFTDVTEEAGVGLVAQGMGATVGDFDNDGDLDLYVTTFGDNVLYRNEGGDRFVDVTTAARANDPRWSSSAAFLDYDRDGDLDLFIGNYVDFTPAGNKPCTEPAGGRDYCAPQAYRSVPDRLLRNRGDGTFEDATEAAGITRADGNALGVVVGDYDGDGWPDLYVANDATPNQLWMNRRDGTFEDMGPLSGTAYNAAGRPEGSMGVASGDYDGDGDEDLVVTNLTGETFVLYENDGTGGFEDRRAAVGLAAPTAMMTGFGADWFDADNDGHLDLFVANGAVNVIPSLRATSNPFRQRNQLFVTEPVASPAAASGRSSMRLREVTEHAGPGLDLVEVSRGAAFGDLDLDGRVDVLVTNNGGPVRLLRNVSSGTGHWVRLALRQPRGNRFALGALVRVERAGAPPLVRRVRSGGSYLSSSDLRLHVGLGPRGGLVDVTVTWPDGVVERRAGLAVDREHAIVRAR